MFKKLLVAAVAAAVSTSALSFTQQYRSDWVIIGDEKYVGGYAPGTEQGSTGLQGHGLLQRVLNMGEGFRVMNFSRQDNLAWVVALTGIGSAVSNNAPHNANVIVDLGTTDFRTNPGFGMTVGDFKNNYRALIESIRANRPDLNVSKVWCVVPAPLIGQSLGTVTFPDGPVDLIYGGYNTGFVEPMNAYGETHDMYQDAVREIADEGLCTTYEYRNLGSGMFGNTVDLGDYTIDGRAMTHAGLQQLWDQAHACVDYTQDYHNDCYYQNSPPWWRQDGFHNPEIVHNY